FSIHVQSLVRPVAREPFAGPQRDVDLVALLVAVLVEERFLPVLFAQGAVVFLHRVGPAVRACRPKPAGVVERATRKQRRAPVPAGPALVALKRTQLRVIALQAWILSVPLADGGDDLLDAGDLSILFRKVIDERGIEHVPGAVEVDFGDAMAIDAPAARLEAGKSPNTFHLASAHPAT